MPETDLDSSIDDFVVPNKPRFLCGILAPDTEDEIENSKPTQVDDSQDTQPPDIISDSVDPSIVHDMCSEPLPVDSQEYDTDSGKEESQAICQYPPPFLPIASSTQKPLSGITPTDMDFESDFKVDKKLKKRKRQSTSVDIPVVKSDTGKSKATRSRSRVKKSPASTIPDNKKQVSLDEFVVDPSQPPPGTLGYDKVRYSHKVRNEHVFSRTTRKIIGGTDSYKVRQIPQDYQPDYNYHGRVLEMKDEIKNALKSANCSSDL